MSDAATAIRAPSALNAIDETEPGNLGSCRIRFFAAGSQIDTNASPPPVANVWCLIVSEAAACETHTGWNATALTG